jgi:excisionase family DNA binding protein
MSGHQRTRRALTELGTYGIKDISKRFAVGQHTVLQWIHSGELQAINVGRRVRGRPKWRISHDALEQFERARTPRKVTVVLPS